MTSFRLISVAAAALLFAQLHEAGAEPPQKATAKTFDCLAKMNAEREAASLVPFTTPAEPAKKIPTDELGASAICDALVKDRDLREALYKPTDVAGTFAVYFAFGEEEVCSEAIDFWKAFKLPFADLPPVYQSDTESPYNTYQIRSLLALFNPQASPTMSCAFVECPYELQAAQKKWEGVMKGGSGGKQGKQSNDKSSGKTPKEILKECNGEKVCLLGQGTGVLKALTCVTFPPVLVKDKAPYTQDQWDKVRAHVSSGKMYSITAATSFVLAASALWLSAF